MDKATLFAGEACFIELRPFIQRTGWAGFVAAYYEQDKGSYAGPLEH